MKRSVVDALRAAGGALLALLSAGCGQVLGIPTDPELVRTGPWRCLGQTPPEEAAPTSAQAQVTVQACDFISSCTKPVTGLTAQLCDKKDVGCVNPLLVGLTDDAGAFTFQVPTAGSGFDGYLLVTATLASCTDATTFGSLAGPALCGAVVPACNVNAPDDKCLIPTYAPSLFFFNPPVVHDVAQPLPLQLFPTTGLPSIIKAAGIQLQADTGNLLLEALDCDGNPAPDVSYSIEANPGSASALYINDGVVSRSFSRTDSTGIGGFVDVPPGFVSVVATNADSVAVGQVGVQAVASTLTYSVLLPQP